MQSKPALKSPTGSSILNVSVLVLDGIVHCMLHLSGYSWLFPETIRYALLVTRSWREESNRVAEQVENACAKNEEFN